MSSLIVQPTIPTGAISHSVSSASKHIIKSNLQRYYPESQTDYSPQSNSELVFHISSPSDMWDPTQSYVRFKLTASLTNTADDFTRYLSEGGVHSLFQRVEIFTRAGVLIERIDEYNKLYALMSSATMDRDFVDQSCHDEADSGKPYELLYRDLALDDDATAYTDSTGIIGGVPAATVSELRVGDLVRIETTANVVYYAAITVIDGTNITIAPKPGADIAAAALKEIGVARKTTRQLAASTPSYDVCFTPYSPFLYNGSYIPLQLIRGGLRVVFTLVNNAAYSIVSNSAASPAFTNCNFTISNPEYMCQMYQPDESLNAKMLDMFKAGGLHYLYPIYRHFLDVESNGQTTANLQHHVNARSVRSVYQKIQDKRANTVSADNADALDSTFFCDAAAQGLKAGLDEYQYAIGSLRFPDSAPTKLSSISNAEAMKELKRTLGQCGAVNVFGKRMLPDEWRAEKSEYLNENANKTESQRLILSASMARDPTPFSGVDASLANLQSELKFGTQYDAGSRYIHSWVESDCVLTLSQDSIVRRT